MSRKIAYAYLGLLAATSAAAGSDVGNYPPGQKPFHAPKAPKPSGVLADTCFGYFETRWTLGAACTVGPCGGPCVPPVKTVVVTTEPLSAPARVVTIPPPAPQPMPPAKR